jgi:hypothetical protein
MYTETSKQKIFNIDRVQISASVLKESVELKFSALNFEYLLKKNYLLEFKTNEIKDSRTISKTSSIRIFR